MPDIDRGSHPYVHEASKQHMYACIHIYLLSLHTHLHVHAHTNICTQTFTHSLNYANS